MTFYPILIGLILISNYEIVNSITCKNKQGIPVDYWVAYKPPKHVDMGYFYISGIANPNQDPSFVLTSEKRGIINSLSGSISNVWQHSTHSIESHESIVYQTFREFYEGNNKQHNYAMFSDKKPQDTPSQTLASNVPSRKKLFVKHKKFGAPKGVIAWDNSNGNGFWVMSSISSFGPFLRKNYQWGETSHSSSKPSMFKFFSKKSSPSNPDNGHLTMCLSFVGDETKKVLEHLITMNVQVYDKNIQKDDSFLKGATESANKLFKRNYEKSFTGLLTLEARFFYILRKKANSFGNAYDKLFDKSLNFKSYSSQPKSRMKSFMGKLKRKVTSTIQDILEIQILDKKWPANEDESNWAVSRDLENVFCFSDLGHHAEFTDAGAMVCMNKPELNDAFLKSAIVKTI